MEVYRRCGPLIWYAGDNDRDLIVMQVNQPLDHRQAEAGALELTVQRRVHPARKARMRC